MEIRLPHRRASGIRCQLKIVTAARILRFSLNASCFLLVARWRERRLVAHATMGFAAANRFLQPAKHIVPDSVPRLRSRKPCGAFATHRRREFCRGMSKVSDVPLRAI